MRAKHREKSFLGPRASATGGQIPGEDLSLRAAGCTPDSNSLATRPLQTRHMAPATGEARRIT